MKNVFSASAANDNSKIACLPFTALEKVHLFSIVTDYSEIGICDWCNFCFSDDSSHFTLSLTTGETLSLQKMISHRPEDNIVYQTTFISKGFQSTLPPNLSFKAVLSSILYILNHRLEHTRSANLGTCSSARPSLYLIEDTPPLG